MRKWLVLLLILLLVLSGCSGESAGSDTALSVYYLNLQGTKLLSYEHEPVASDTEELAVELLNAMNEAPSEDAISVTHNKYGVNTVELDYSILKVYLEGERTDTVYGTYLLGLAAITRTLTQLDGVDAVALYLNGENITDFDHRGFGVLRNSLFVNNAANGEEDYREAEVKLYFANDGGNRLIEVTKNIYYSNNVAPERAVVEALIQGPDSGEGLPTVSDSTVLLGINVRDRVCYVNFDRSFMANMTNVDDKVSVFSIVNTLTSLEGIDKVQFSINASADVTVGVNGISLSEPFEYFEAIVDVID